MRGKQFQGRRSWRTLFGAGLAIVLAAMLAFVLVRLDLPKLLLVLSLAIGVLAVVTFVLLRRAENIEYELGENKLLVRRGGTQVELPLGEVLDANLVDLASARDIVEEKMAERQHHGERDASADQAMLTRYCGIPLRGLASVGSGINRINVRNFRRTLVLLRMHGGRAMILSPKRSEGMVSAINKALEQNNRDVGHT